MQYRIEDVNIRVLFVGDTPPKNELNDNFLSYQNHKVFLSWLKILGVREYEALGINRVDPYFLESAQSFTKKNLPIIALGMSARKSLTNAKILHHYLPHPNSQNYTRTKAQVTILLRRAKLYIDSIELFYKK